MPSNQSAFGVINLHYEGGGPEVPVANAVAYGTTAGGCNYSLGQFAVKGDLAETDTGIVALEVVNGASRISGNNEDGKGVALCTDPNFSAALNFPIMLDARVNMQALTTRNIFFGLGGLVADDIAPPLVSATVTHTLTDSNLAGFHMDSGLTAGTTWHAVFNGGTTTGQTVSTSTVITGENALPVAGEYDLLRLVVVNADGDCEWYIDGELKFAVSSAISTSVLHAAILGCWGTTGTAADIDVDFIHVEAQRDMTR